ncbi:MAG: superoxide dismutase family protein [Actinomycetota bacterium]
MIGRRILETARLARLRYVLKRRSLIAGLAIASLALGLLTAGVSASDAAAAAAKAVLHDGKDRKVAVVKFIQQGDKVLVKAEAAFATDLTPGFKGFHIHAVGVCAAPFTSAGGHYVGEGTTHGDHDGDMPVLLVMDDGTASSRFKTDRFSVEDLIGLAVIVHAGADNFGNVPTGTGATQYTPNSTGTTNDTATGLTANTGNAGGRHACGVIDESD